MAYSTAKASKTLTSQAYRFQKMVNTIGEYLLKKAKKVLNFIHYGVSYERALMEVISMSRKLFVSIETRKIRDKQNRLVAIEIIPV